MGLFDLLTNFDPDAVMKKFDDFEKALDETIDKVSSAAEKVENTAGVVEKKLVPGANASSSNTATKDTSGNDPND